MPDIDLTVTVKDANTAKTLAAFEDAQGEQIEIRVGDHGSFVFTGPLRNNGAKAFGELVLKRLGRAYMKAARLNKDWERLVAESALIPPIQHDIPEDILE